MYATVEFTHLIGFTAHKRAYVYLDSEYFLRCDTEGLWMVGFVFVLGRLRTNSIVANKNTILTYRYIYIYIPLLYLLVAWFSTCRPPMSTRMEHDIFDVEHDEWVTSTYWHCQPLAVGETCQYCHEFKVCQNLKALIYRLVYIKIVVLPKKIIIT